MQRLLHRWLEVPAINDPVDRRNAPMLQVVLILLSTTPPLLWLMRILNSATPWRPGETASFSASMCVSAIAFGSLLLIRRGRFQWAIRLVLTVVAIMTLLTYASAGMGAQMYEMPLLVMWLFMAGMMVSRRALWLMYTVLILSLTLGGLTDVRVGGHPDIMHDVVIRAVMFLLITIVIDRASAALRGSLADVTRQATVLVETNARLSGEIDARERVQAQLLHAQKVEAVGRMASGITHDFNHLLSLMLGYVERGRRSRDADELHAVLDGLELAVKRATAITHKLLRFARNDVRQIECFDAGEAIREIAPMLRQTLGARIKLDLALTDVAMPILFDRAQFALALLNMAANAAQAMPDGGHFTLRLTFSDGQDDVRIEFIDTGHGVPLELRERIFEPFFTTRPAGQGTGLGLSVVAGLVQDADGSLTLDSAAELGAHFVMRLPLATQRERSTKAA